MATMRRVSQKESKVQFNLYLSPATVQRLEKLSEKYKKGGRTKVGAEIIEQFWPMWQETQEHLKDLRKRQRESLRGMAASMLDEPGTALVPEADYNVPLPDTDKQNGGDAEEDAA